MFKAFLLGFFAVIPALIIELILEAAGTNIASHWLPIIRAFIIAALVEETVKLAVVRLFIYPRSEFNEITDGIIYTITAGLGFAFFENILYSFGPPLVLIVRGITAVPLHAISSGFLGYYIGVSKIRGKPQFGRGLLAAILIHGFYDYLLFTDSLVSLLILPMLVLLGFILNKLIQRAQEQDRESDRILGF